MILYVLGGIIAFFVSILWKSFVIEFLNNHDIKVVNYNKKEIPIGIGILLLLSSVVSSSFIVFFTDQPMMYYVYLFGLSFIGFAGILDDLVEENKIKGLKGHLSKMYQGELTSGGLKAIIGGLTALYVSFSFSISLMDLLLNTLIILFFINTMNLFDVRPGRALKIFIIISILIWIFSKAPDRFLTLILIGSILTIIKGDLREEYMLGDVGANILGYTLGFTSAISFNMNYKIPIIVLLIILHIISEMTSISLLINKNVVLKYIDEIGRLKE
ncbi:MAG TPA: phospho-N-acetylmuramoyl-pentapeptide-transferase [Epulopiscium sp.]|nr:phospho-N-acetylmuramoyl-pentapeptide-transferase [Candidatus Epulonipiscium sp.]